MTDARDRGRGELSRGQIRVVHKAFRQVQVPVEVEEARSWLPEISGRGRKHGTGSDDVASPRLPLQSLAEPEKRRPFAIGMSRLFDQAMRYARRRLAPRRSAVVQQRLELVPPGRVHC